MVKAESKAITAGRKWEVFYVNTVVSVQVAEVIAQLMGQPQFPGGSYTVGIFAY